MKINWLPVAAAALLLAACATNPVTGKREFNIVSEAQEQQLGEEAARQVLQEFRVYDEKPELNKKVNDIGQRIAAVSDRPNLNWTFTILDTPIVNAMSLPGGHVYVTRGLLERMNSDDELAGVIAHEITHVAARHAAERISQAELAQVGLVFGSIVAGPAATQAYGSLAQLGTQLLFLRYSRQQESHADQIGTAYMAEAGYNPLGAERMLLSLQRMDTSNDAAERYFIDHPDPAKRVRDVRSELKALQAKSPTITSGVMDRSSFVRQLAGIVTGPSTIETVITRDAIYDRLYGIVLPIPNGWRGSIEPGTLFVMAPPRAQNTAVIVQEIPLSQLAGYPNLQTAVRSKLQEQGLQYVNSTSVAARTGQRFGIDLWAARTQSGVVAVETTTLPEQDRGLVFMQITQGRSRTGSSPLASTLAEMSFDMERARSVQPPRMRTETSRAGETWADVAARATGRREDARQIAAMNGFDVREAIPVGILLKLPADVVREEGADKG